MIPVFFQSKIETFFEVLFDQLYNKTNDQLLKESPLSSLNKEQYSQKSCTRAR